MLVAPRAFSLRYCHSTSLKLDARTFQLAFPTLAMPRPADALRLSDDRAVAAEWADLCLRAVLDSLQDLSVPQGDVERPVDGTRGLATGSQGQTASQLLRSVGQLLERDSSEERPESREGADESQLADAGKEWRRGAPEDPSRELEELLKRVCQKFAPISYTAGNGGFMGYIPGGGIWSSVLAEFVGAALNRYVGANFAAPALCALEGATLRWFAEWMGFNPEEAGGAFTTGGSSASMMALVAARTDKLTPETFPKAVLYASEVAHHSVEKDARFIGLLGPEQVKFVPAQASNSFRMDEKRLEEMILEDQRAGLVPFAVVSTCGTTATGAIDPLANIARICRLYNLWHHCDGAYGAFFRLVPSLRDGPLHDIKLVDSLTLDPHKSLFLPYGTGALLVRDRNTLLRASTTSANYLPAIDSDGELDYWNTYNPMDNGVELSRE
jgi:aromatic-L-amino-acid/L-tryptophan decarboxylase